MNGQYFYFVLRMCIFLHALHTCEPVTKTPTPSTTQPGETDGNITTSALSIGVTTPSGYSPTSTESIAVSTTVATNNSSTTPTSVNTEGAFNETKGADSGSNVELSNSTPTVPPSFTGDNILPFVDDDSNITVVNDTVIPMSESVTGFFNETDVEFPFVSPHNASTHTTQLATNDSATNDVVADVSTTASVPANNPTTVKSEQTNLPSPNNTDDVTQSPDVPTNNSLTEASPIPTTSEILQEESTEVPNVTSQPEDELPGVETTTLYGFFYEGETTAWSEFEAMSPTTDRLESDDNMTDTSADFPTGPSALQVELVIALVLGVLCVAIVVTLVGKKCYDSYQKRHYSRIDYLINGMYN